MENTFQYWQQLDDEAWVAQLSKRLRELSPEEKKTSIAWELSEEHWREQLETGHGPLARIPIALKDLFDFKGLPTTASSLFLPEVRGSSADADSALVERLKSLGGVVVAKTHLNEFAYGLDGRNPHFGDCPHPFILRRVSGGSSSGSAFLVARGVVPLAVGTDTGGSIRVPASYCGLYGYRARPGWLAQGCFPLAPRFDTVGWFTSNFGDLISVLKAMNAPGIDRFEEKARLGIEPASFKFPEPFLAFSKAKGFVFAPDLNATFTAQLADWTKCFTILQSTQAWEIHREWMADYRFRYDPLVWERIIRGQRWTDKEHYWAQITLERFNQFCARAFHGYAMVGLPAAPSAAPTYEAAVSKTLRSQTLEINVLGSLGGFPALIMPIPGLDEPIGMQVLLRN
ncbi:MAG: amidase family protein [Xenococcaceae cyanobacterium]